MAGMRIGVVCPELRRHLDPTLALAREIGRRGHHVTVFAAPRIRARVEAEGLAFHPVGAPEDADGSATAAWAASLERAGASRGRAAARALAVLARVHVRDLSVAAEVAGLEGLVVDVACPGAAAVAERRRLPYVVSCPTLFGSASDEAPPPVMALRIAAGRLARWRNRAAAHVTRRAVERWAHRLGPPGVLPLDLVFSPHRGLARVSPMPQFFDAPQRLRVSRLHYTGPWTRSNRVDRPTGAVPASNDGAVVVVRMGTPGGRTQAVLDALARAAPQLPGSMALVGEDGADAARSAGAPPGWPRVGAAGALARASVLVTDADLDVVLEGLASGVPMVCVPSCLDQPGVARRVERLGAGIVVPASGATPDRLAAAIRKALTDPALRERATSARRSLALVHGGRLAADVVERALVGGRPISAPGAAQSV